MEAETVNPGEKEITIERRYRVLQVTPEFLISLFVGNTIKRVWIFENALPLDARIVGVGPINPIRQTHVFDASHGVVGILIESDSFENVLPGCPIPILEPPKFRLIEEAPQGIEAKCPACGELALMDARDFDGPKKLCAKCGWTKRTKQ